MTKNYDLNIWDKVGYETNYEQEGWAITVHEIPNNDDGVPYGSGRIVTTLDLSKDEATALTLGIAQADGGDYCPDEDFWLDIVSFFLTYTNIPVRVMAFLKSLFEEEEVRDDGLLSLWQEIGTPGD